MPAQRTYSFSAFLQISQNPSFLSLYIYRDWRMGILLWFDGSNSNISCSSSTPKHVYILSLLLLLFCAQAMRSVEGRSFAKQLQELAKDDGDLVRITMIGSRPPRCAGKCLNCGPCEAVQVPAVSHDKSGIARLSAATNSRGDDGSNYKPLSWKCKCGGVILNP